MLLLFFWINSQQNKNTAFINLNVSPLHYLSEDKINTKSHFDWLLCFTSDGRREKFFEIVAGCSNQEIFSIKCQTALRLSPSKLNVSSVLLPLSLSFIAVHLSERMKRNFLGANSTSFFHKDAVIYHRVSSSKHYPYVQKQASKRPQPNPCRLDVNVLNNDNMCNFILNVFQKLLRVPQWQTLQLLKIIG